RRAGRRARGPAHAQEPRRPGHVDRGMDRTAQVHGYDACAQTHSALPGVEAAGAPGLGAAALRTGCLPGGAGHKPSAHGQIQEVRLGMKILVLFDIARRADPEESFSARSLKEEDKPTEADVLKC